MLFEVNSNNNLNSQRSVKRASNLLSMAVASFSAGSRASPNPEDSAGWSVSEQFEKTHRQVRQVMPKPSRETSSSLFDAIGDHIYASPSGWARMEALSSEQKAPDASSPEIAAEKAHRSMQDIIEKPENALLSQANQSPASVMRLLE